MSSPINSNVTYSQDVRSFAQEKKENTAISQKSSVLEQEKTSEVQEPIAVSAKQQLNASIIESSLKFSNTLGDQPLSLVLKTALQGINEALREGGIKTSVEDAFESGLDVSPEATAERIVAFSTQFLPLYQEQHPEMSEEESLTTFVEIIKTGIDLGFAEARDILSSLNVLEGDVASNIDTTYGFVQEGLQSFVDSFSKKGDE